MLDVPEFVALVSSQNVTVATSEALRKGVSDFAPTLDVFLDVSTEIQSHTFQFALVAHFTGAVQSESFVHC